jgi:hypothetical protein
LDAKEKIKRGMKDVIFFSRLSLLSSALADLGRETGLDGRDGTSGTARVAGDEVETVLTLVELCIRRAAGLASNVLDCFVSVSFFCTPLFFFCSR